jgi:hypothetical protein
VSVIRKLKDLLRNETPSLKELLSEPPSNELLFCAIFEVGPTKMDPLFTGAEPTENEPFGE